MVKQEELSKKSEKAKDEIAFFEKKGNKLLSEIFEKSNWYPTCHNDHSKMKCDHCMNCWSINCNRSNCDRDGRCMCPDTNCICLGR